MNLMNLEGNSLAVALVTAIIVAILVEIVKMVDKKSLMSANFINLLSLAFGLAVSMIFMTLFKGVFSEYVFIGLIGGVTSSGVYEIVNNIFGGAKNE